MCTQQRAKWTFPSFLHASWFASEMEVYMGLIFADSRGLFELPLKPVSAKTVISETHHCACPINGCSVCDYRLSLCLAWLWGEIYDPAWLANEQINRFVFDIVRCILGHPVHHCAASRSETDNFSLSFVEARHSRAQRAFVVNEHTRRFCWVWYKQPFLLPGCYQPLSAGTSWTLADAALQEKMQNK